MGLDISGISADVDPRQAISPLKQQLKMLVPGGVGIIDPQIILGTQAWYRRLPEDNQTLTCARFNPGKRSGFLLPGIKMMLQKCSADIFGAVKLVLTDSGFVFKTTGETFC